MAILDTGCNRSIAERRWTDEYISAMGEEDKRKVKTKEVTNGQKFRFGGGKVFVATQEV